MPSLNDLFNEIEQVTVKEDTLEQKAKHKAKVEREFKRGVELGWYDVHGNSLLPDDDETEDENDD